MRSVPGLQRSQFTLSEEQIRLLLLHEIDLRNRIILELFIFCGLRRHELATMEISRLDFERLQFTVVGKGYHCLGKIRNVTMPPFLADKLKKFIGKRRHGYVFPGRKYGHLTDRAVQNVVVVAGDRIGFKQSCPSLKHLSAHMLRHTFARQLKNKGFDFEELAMLLGHQNIFKTVSMYGTKTWEEVSQKAQAANNAWSGT